MNDRRWTIGQLARASGVTVRTLHYYDQIGLVSPGERIAAGHRRYVDADVRRLCRVRALGGLGLSLEDVAAVLREGTDDLGSLRDLLTAQLADLEIQADRIEASTHRVRSLLDRFAGARERTYRGANARDAAMADNVDWILKREQRIVIGAADGHLQRWPYRVPPIINEDQVMLGQHLAHSLGDDFVVIATTYNGGEMFVHRPNPGGPPGHTAISYEDLAPLPSARLEEREQSLGGIR